MKSTVWTKVFHKQAVYPRNCPHLISLSNNIPNLNKTRKVWSKPHRSQISHLFSTIRKHAMPGL